MSLLPNPMLKEEVDMTIAIPTCNGAKRFPDVLERLRAQKGMEDIRAEILIVDNNSTDDTFETFKRYQADWPAAFPLRYVMAKEQGQAFARNIAAAEGRGEFLGFLDDDNLPSPYWVANAVRFGREHSRAGAFASCIREQLDAPLPPDFDQISVYLAMFNLGPESLLLPKHGLLPPSAGLVVRRQAWVDCAPKDPLFRGRFKNSDNIYTYRNSGSEDIEAIIHIQNHDWEIWYCAGMEIDHKLSSSRLDFSHLGSIIRGTGNAKFYTRMLRRKPWQRPLYTILFFASDLVKLIVHYWKNRANLHTNIAAAEQQAYVGALLSPFLHLRAKLRGEF